MIEAFPNQRFAGQLYNDFQKPAKYNEIIRAAVKLFNEKGYKATSIRDIAASINLTQGTIYHYVKNKEELLFEINARVINAALERVKEISAMQCSNREKIRRNIKEILVSITIYNDYLSVFLKEYKGLSHENLEEMLKKRKEYEEIIKSIFEAGIKNKEFKNLDPKIATMAFFGICNWATTWLMPNGRLTIEEIADILSNIYLEGICCFPSDKELSVNFKEK
jgi:AcrR family transcriptional regulator